MVSDQNILFAWQGDEPAIKRAKLYQENQLWHQLSDHGLGVIDIGYSIYIAKHELTTALNSLPRPGSFVPATGKAVQW